MSAVLQERIIPDWQCDMYRPLTGKDHFNGPANIENLVTGQCRVNRTCGNVEGSEGHRHVAQCTALSQEVKRQEAALGLAVDTLLHCRVKAKKSINIVTVLDVENHLRGEERKTRC